MDKIKIQGRIDELMKMWSKIPVDSSQWEFYMTKRILNEIERLEEYLKYSL